MKHKRKRRTVFLVARRDCENCQGEGWKMVAVTKGTQTVRRAMRCLCVKVVRVDGHKKTYAEIGDGKMRAAEGSANE